MRPVDFGGDAAGRGESGAGDLGRGRAAAAAGGAGLLDDPAAGRPATSRAVARMVKRLGFVQVDTISTVERAHHLILAARMNGYRPELLARAIERDRLLFEHWTHDASVIPLEWYPQWRHRFGATGRTGGTAPAWGSTPTE